MKSLGIATGLATGLLAASFSAATAATLDTVKQRGTLAAAVIGSITAADAAGVIEVTA